MAAQKPEATVKPSRYDLCHGLKARLGMETEVQDEMDGEVHVKQQGDDSHRMPEPWGMNALAGSSPWCN